MAGGLFLCTHTGLQSKGMKKDVRRGPGGRSPVPVYTHRTSEIRYENRCAEGTLWPESCSCIPTPDFKARVKRNDVRGWPGGQSSVSLYTHRTPEQRYEKRCVEWAW